MYQPTPPMFQSNPAPPSGDFGTKAVAHGSTGMNANTTMHNGVPQFPHPSQQSFPGVPGATSALSTQAMNAQQAYISSHHFNGAATKPNAPPSAFATNGAAQYPFPAPPFSNPNQMSYSGASQIPQMSDGSMQQSSMNQSPPNNMPQPPHLDSQQMSGTAANQIYQSSGVPMSHMPPTPHNMPAPGVFGIRPGGPSTSVPQAQPPMSNASSFQARPPFNQFAHDTTMMPGPPSLPGTGHDSNAPPTDSNPSHMMSSMPNGVPQMGAPQMIASQMTAPQMVPQQMHVPSMPPPVGNNMGSFAPAAPMSDAHRPQYGTGSVISGPPSVGEMMGHPSGLYQQRPRLDPNLMPSVAQVIEEDRSTRSGVFPTGYPNAEHPPLTSTEFIAQDQGNCNPKLMRSSLYVAPAVAEMLKSSQVPFVVAITPFARLHPEEMRPPIVDLGELGPVRCHRCKAYMCPFMEFQDGGRRFKCPFCMSSTAVEETYFAHLDHTGRRTDIQHRPEQFLGAYEFIATKQYCKNGLKPKQPAFIFMVDVSYSAVQCGMVSVFCKNIRNLLNNLPKDYGEQKSSMLVGFATYDQTIHFYNLKNQMGQPEMLVVGDVNDVFVPMVEGFLVTLDEADAVINSLLNEIEKMFAETRITETMLGPVIQAGLDALKCADRSGKLFIFHANLPLLEAPGKLKNRDDRKLLGTEKEKTVLQPGTDFYGKLGEECVKAGCAVDIFLFPNAFVDVASLSPVCSLTGGSIYKYQYFEVQKDSKRFLAELSHNIGREIVFDVMMRVRASTGLRPTGFFGAFYMDNSTDMEMSIIDCDKAVHVELRHDDKLPEGNAYIQTAVLFTSCSGQRRLRIINLSLPVTTDYNHLYRIADPDCLVSFLFKQAEYILRDKSPNEMREILNSRCAQMLAIYREKCSQQAPLGQLILPECLKLLPLYASCIIKNDALCGGSDMTVDDRAYLTHLISSLRVEDALLSLYPTVFPISDLTFDQQAAEIAFPPCIRASYENLAHDKAYVIYNGIMLFIWIGLQIPQEWVQDVFESNSVTHLNTENHIVPERDNARSRAVRGIIERINSGRPRCVKIFVIRQQDALEGWMKKFLVEDRTANMPSYIDYLCNIHRKIRTLLS